MPTIASGGDATITVAAGQILTVQSNGATFDYESPVGTRVGEHSCDTVFGPFTAAGSVKVVSVQGALFYEIGTMQPSEPNAQLTAWGLAQAFRLVSATRNSDGAITTASIVWPDGTTGTYTADTLSTSFPGATDAWRATYVGTPSKTVTQPGVTRDSNGAVTAQPALTIT